MASQNANIGVVIGGDVTPLQQSLARGSSLISSFTAKARTAATDIAKIGAASAAAAAGGLTAIYNQQSKVIDSLAKTSDALNISISKLQALHHISELNGVSQESMNKNLQRMEMRLGEAARKGGLTADALDEVGLSVSDIINLKPDEQIEQLAKAISDVENQSVKASIASDLFGREGLKMLKVLKALETEGLQPTIQELDALGVSLTRLDAAKVEAANDSMFRVAQSISAAGQAITVELAPFVDAAAQQFIEMAKEAGGFGNIASEAMQRAAKAVGFVADAVHGVKVVFSGLHVVAAGVGTGIVTIFNGVVGKVDELMRSMIDGVNAVTDQLSRIPGVDINDIGYPEFGNKVNEITESSIANLIRLKDEFNSLAMQPLPSDGVEQFLDTVKQKSIEAAEAVAAVTDQNLTKDQSSDDQEDPKITALKERFMTEQELQKQHDQTMMDIGEEFNASSFDSEAQWREIKAQAIAEHTNKLGKIREKEKLSAVNIASSMASSLMSLAQGQSKKSFEISKKVAMASAVVKGYEAATSAWAAGMATGGPWAPAIAAAYTAASLAKTGAQIQSINSQSFSGGGSQSNAGGSSFPTADSVSGGQASSSGDSSGGGGNSPTQISFVGIQEDGVYFGRTIISAIKGAVDDGADFNFSAGN